jgi:hypothetical protein
MTDSDPRIARRYRQLAREEPPAALDRAILDRARARVPARARHRWMAPVSIAAVLVLGIGIALRMQLEEPGIETSAPAPGAPPPGDKAERAQARPDAPVHAPERKAATAARKEAPGAKPFANEAQPAPRTLPPAPKDTAEHAFVAPPPAASSAARDAAPAPAPVQSSAVPVQPPAAPVQPSAAPTEQPATPALAPARPPAAAAETSQSAPQRLKREAAGADALGASAAGKLGSPEAVRDRELERIAALREAGRHAEADRALEEFRRRYPDFRIPPAAWERVRPR